MEILIFILISYILLSITLIPLFKKAGVENATYKALTPGVNFIEWCKLIGRPQWWALLLLVPILNIFIFVGMAVHMMRSFAQYSFKDTALATIYAPLAFFLLGKDKKAKYLSPIVPRQKAYFAEIEDAKKNNQKLKLQKLIDKNPYKKSASREWVESIIFAVFAAAFIRMFLVEAFIIPTSSMEGSLLVGDFLFVSKPSYGLRMPQTYVMLPLLHNRIPKLNKESYLESPSLGYHRLPKIRTIKRMDPVVFNYPEGDSVIITPGRTYGVYDFHRQGVEIPANQKIITRPVDKKDHYIKRCIGLPGETIEIKDKVVMIDGKAIENPKKVQYRYRVESSSGAVSQKRLDDIGVSVNDINPNQGVLYNLQADQVETIKSWGGDIRVEYVKPQHQPNYLFPHDEKHFPKQTMDNFGPIHIPKKGETIDLSLSNIAVYSRIIGTYEENDLKIDGDKIFINGQEATSYTFKMDYYWMMGDNRDNSEDSRVWGFVPENHIVGRPLFIWMSLKNGSLFNGIRWNRVFRSATAN